MIVIPETDSRKDWPRLVAKAFDDLSRRVRGLERFPGFSVTSSGILSEGFTEVNATAGPVTMTLPPLRAGTRVLVKKTDASANAVTIDGAGGDMIDGVATYVLAAQYEAVLVISGTGGWYII